VPRRYTAPAAPPRASTVARVLLALLLATLLPPVPGEIVRPFDYGADPFAPGQHRGIDLSASPGEPVQAACSGRLVAAGRVAGRGVVSISCRGRRVSHLPLERIAVEAGATVRRGARVGTVAAGHPGLHLGVRKEGDPFGYIDPTPLLLRMEAPPSLPLLPAPRRGRRVPLRPPPPTPAPAHAREPRPAPARHPAPVRRPAPARRPALAPWPAYVGLGLVAAGCITGGVSRRRRRRGAHATTAAGHARA
jgi:hypothetical protein